MPRINSKQLIKCLLKQHRRLLGIWLECTDTNICDLIKNELDYIELMIRTIEYA
jgi:hypothetical protein